VLKRVVLKRAAVDCSELSLTGIGPLAAMIELQLRQIVVNSVAAALLSGVTWCLMHRCNNRHAGSCCIIAMLVKNQTDHAQGECSGAAKTTRTSTTIKQNNNTDRCGRRFILITSLRLQVYKLCLLETRCSTAVDIGARRLKGGVGIALVMKLQRHDG
jgi:hypothetical protein